MRAKFSKVLIVDDDPIILEVMKAFFAKHGVLEVITARNGTEAVARLDEDAGVDLIISDLNMPGYDGVELLTHLDIIKSRIPVTIVSSAKKSIIGGASGLAMAYQLNFLGATTKPLKLDQFAVLLGLSDPEATPAP